MALPDRDTPGATNYSQAARDEDRLPTTEEIQVSLQTNIADFSGALDAFEESAIVLIDAVAAAVEAANSTNYSSCDATLLVIGAAASAPNASDAGSIISSVAAALQVLDPNMLDAEAITLATPFGTLAAAAAINADALSDDISDLFGGENGLSEVRCLPISRSTLLKSALSPRDVLLEWCPESLLPCRCSVCCLRTGTWTCRASTSQIQQR